MYRILIITGRNSIILDKKFETEEEARAFAEEYCNKIGYYDYEIFIENS